MRTCLILPFNEQIMKIFSMGELAGVESTGFVSRSFNVYTFVDHMLTTRGGGGHKEHNLPPTQYLPTPNP